MTDIDAVAEAIWRADHEGTVDARGLQWEKSIYREHYRSMAQAAIDALGLREETANRPVLAYDEPPARKDNRMVLGPDGFWATHFEFVPSSRLVSEWEPHVEHADSMRPWVEEQPT